MRISIVPAQITTVEDKLIGNISVQQAVFLGIPVLFGFIVALLLPPLGQFIGYKIVFVMILFFICGSLALRIKERVVAEWLKLFVVYFSRPLYFVYDKNSMYLRSVLESDGDDEAEKPATIQEIKPTVQSSLSSKEYLRLQSLVKNTASNVRFEVSKKGELHVHVTETK